MIKENLSELLHYWWKIADNSVLSCFDQSIKVNEVQKIDNGKGYFKSGFVGGSMIWLKRGASDKLQTYP